MAPDTPDANNTAHATNTPHSDGSTATPTTENINRTSPPKSTSDTPLLPHAASSGFSTATDVASDVVSTVKSAVDDAASTVKIVASSALEWTEAKVEKLSAEKEDGTGPYGSVGTCAPSDLDPIGQGVLPALPVAKKGDERRGEGKEGENKGEGS